MGTVRRVTDAQVKELRGWLQQGASLKKVAMKAGMDRKSAHKYRESGPLPSAARQPRRRAPEPGRARCCAVWTGRSGWDRGGPAGVPWGAGLGKDGGCGGARVNRSLSQKSTGSSVG